MGRPVRVQGSFLYHCDGGFGDKDGQRTIHLWRYHRGRYLCCALLVKFSSSPRSFVRFVSVDLIVFVDFRRLSKMPL
jgi:hypothetical protein